MTPLLTINLLRALFVIFACTIGSTIGGELFDSQVRGGIYGLTFGLAIVLVDRLLRGISLRIFSSATFGLLLGLIFLYKSAENVPLAISYIFPLYRSFSGPGILSAFFLGSQATGKRWHSSGAERSSVWPGQYLSR